MPFGLTVVKNTVLQDIKEEMSLYKRTLEDIGWINLSMDQYTREELIAGGFVFMLKRCRIMYVNSPLVKHWVHLTTSFVFGQGLSAPKAKTPSLQPVVTKFWDDPDNQKTITSFPAQRMIGNKIQYEGNLFFILFDDEEGNVRCRLLNCIEVMDIIQDNDDRNRILFYKVSLTNRNYDYVSDAYKLDQPQVEYIPDIDNEQPQSYGVPPNKLRLDCKIYQVKVNCDINDKFGIPDIYSGLDWVKAHKDMAGDMATLIKALSKFAWKKKVSGGAAQVNSILGAMKSKTNLTNISTMAGQTQIENKGIDLEAIDVKTGGIDIAEQGLKAMQMMVCSASGIFYHYFGDPSTGNLATATSMELPMVKKFQDYQMLWQCIYKTLIMYMLRKKIEVGLIAGSIVYDEKTKYTYIQSPIDLTIDVDFPPILEKDVQELATALQIAKNAGLISEELAARLFMLGMEVDDIDDEIATVLAENKAKADLVQSNLEASQQPPQGANKAPGDPGNNQQRNNYAQPSLAEALKRLVEAIDTPQKPGTRLDKKSNYLNQRMNGYRKALAGHYLTLQKDIKASSAVGGIDDKYVGTVKNPDKALTRFANGMKHSARIYFPEAIKIGEKYVQAHLKETNQKINETLYETSGRADGLLQEKLAWNTKYIDTSLVPDIAAKIDSTIKQPYIGVTEFNTALAEALLTFEGRMEQYVGAMWTVEESAVKEAGKGTGLEVDFVGEDDEHSCQECADAVENSPYPIDEAPQPGELTCLGNCRHALQIREPSTV